MERFEWYWDGAILMDAASGLATLNEKQELLG